MKKVIALGLVAIAMSVTSIDVKANAALGNCMVDSLNGKERKELAKWIFFAMSSHPEIKVYRNASDETIDNTDKQVGYLITRLLSEDCPAQAKAAAQSGGSIAIQKSFETVGAIAMQELMADPSVAKGISSFEKYLDKEKLQKVGM